jgi:hypothetical protein
MYKHECLLFLFKQVKNQEQKAKKFGHGKKKKTDIFTEIEKQLIHFIFVFSLILFWTLNLEENQKYYFY